MTDSRPLDIFSHQPLSDSHIRKYEHMRFPCNQTLTGTGANPTELVFDTRSIGLDTFMLLQRAFVMLKIKLEKADYTNITDNKSQLVQQVWKLIQHVQLQLSGQEVESVADPGEVAMAKILIQDTDSAIRGSASVKSAYPQSVLGSITLPANPSTTSSLDDVIDRALAAYKTTDNAVFVKLALRDVLGICQIDKAFLGVNLRLRLLLETDHRKVLWRSATSDAAYVSIEQAELYIPVCRPDNETLNSIYTELKSGRTQPIEYEHWEVQKRDIAAGDTTENVALNNFSKRPTAVIVYMKKAADEANNTFASPGRHAGQLFGLGPHRLMVDGKVFPEISYSGSGDGYIHNYEVFCQLGNKHNQDVFGSYVDFASWKANYPYICWDLNCLRDELGAVRSTQPNLRLDMTHAAPGEAALMYIMTVGRVYKEFNLVNDVISVKAPDFSD